MVGDPNVDQAAAVDAAITDMLHPVAVNGASPATVAALREVVLRHKDMWRVQLGADPPADVPPLRIQLIDEAKLPIKITQRGVSPRCSRRLLMTTRRDAFTGGCRHSLHQ